MKIDATMMQVLFSGTHYHRNGFELHEVFEKGSLTSPNGYWGDSFSLVYYLLERATTQYPEFNFGAVCLRSDGGIQEYVITYQWGDYTIMISNQNNHGMHMHMHFTSVYDFCEWLNKHDSFIRLNTRDGGVLKHA